MFDDIPALLPGLQEIYADLHRDPELSFAEVRTAGIVAQRLGDLGYEVTTAVGHTGVVGTLANGAGPTVLLRADMDALPVEEATGLSYASTATGLDPEGAEVPVAHACGHDMHVTGLLGAATQLARHRDAWASGARRLTTSTPGMASSLLTKGSSWTSEREAEVLSRG